MVGALLLAIVLAPSIAIVLILLTQRARLAEGLNLAASAVACAAALALPPLSLAGSQVYWAHYIILDPFGAWVILCAAIVYFLASVYAVGYMRLLEHEAARLPRFYVLFAGFGLTTLIGPMMNNAGLYWIAIELTTLVSTFLVAFERAPESIEAAWKYIIVVSGGISLALLGTVLFYWAGSFVLGPRYDMTWAALRGAAPHMSQALLLLSFLLVLIGYGTKVGLAPMHTWLPDAHSESPAPVSALLSGALLNTAMVGIVRYLAIVDAADPGPLPRFVLVALGAFSLFVAAHVHRPPARHQAPDGLFQRRAHGGDRAWLRLRRAARRRRRAVSHAEPHAEQVADVLRCRQHDAQLRQQGHRRDPRRRPALSGGGRAVARRRGRDHRRAAVRAVRQRVHHPAGRAARSARSGRRSSWRCC